MRRPRRRPIYYAAVTLRDGTVLSAYPERKPAERIMKRERIRIDADNVFRETDVSGDFMSDANNQGRTRFQDIVANRINLQRTLRDLVVPRFETLELQIAEIKAQLDRLEGLVNLVIKQSDSRVAVKRESLESLSGNG